MVITSNGQKTNIGLSLKFEAKALKVIGYSRKDGRYWEFSEKAVKLIRDYKVRRTNFNGSSLSSDSLKSAQVSCNISSIGWW
jgi:hypothetical protein